MTTVSDTDTIFKRLHAELPIFTMDNFLDKNTCERLINYMDEMKPTHVFHTEELTLFNEMEIIQDMNTRLHSIFRIPYEYSSAIYVKKYPIGGYMEPHYDLLNPGNPDHRKTLERCGQTPISIIIYLNDVIDGGETHFIYPDIKVKPERGKLLMWYNLDENGMPYAEMKHGCLRVNSNPKYILTKFFTEYANSFEITSSKRVY